MREVVGYEININDLFNSPPKTEEVLNNNSLVGYNYPPTEGNNEEGIYEYIDEFSKPAVFFKKYRCKLLAVLFLACLVAITIIVILVVPDIFHHAVTATTTPTYNITTTKIPTTTTTRIATQNSEITYTVKTTVTSSDNTKTTYPTTQCQTTTSVDRQCGQDLTNLWLDVVVVVDNSYGMTNDGLKEVAATITSVFGSTKIGTNPMNSKTTRVGVVTYNRNDTVNADLNQFQSYNDFVNGIYHDLNLSTSEQSFLSTGLQAAEHILQTQSSGSSRGHYKKVVIVYASAYQRTAALDPVPVANRLTEDGVFIITVAYDQGGDEGLLYQLSEIATHGMAFNNTGSGSIDLVSDIQNTLLQVNCFCPYGWEQYRISFSDRFSFHYGQCLKLVTIPATWDASKMSCNDRVKNSYLATEQSQAKHDFILDYVKNQKGMDSPYKYNIGLSWNSSQNSWVWEQPAGMSPVSNRGYTNWGAGWPKEESLMMGVQNVQSGDQTYWQNILQSMGSSHYVCEAYSCDTDNYCEGNH
ncbi:hypothetical protein B9Z55_003523 [Caenorhabditis nigoni]|uniref:VWFA domain-containing protein n=1 Tax=Caenorhabditis nigoni TaxID=1611254 RepID=A0A2G5VR35_9PELO|nr:hypothetical protein B9Z55_003523 [Caenorhabditis nigoni]